MRKTWRAYCATYCQPAIKFVGWQHWHGNSGSAISRPISWLRVHISSLKMSIHFSGCRTRSIGVMSSIIKEIKRINLTPVKRIDFRFDPFHKQVKQTRLVSLKLPAHRSDSAEIMKCDWRKTRPIFFFFLIIKYIRWCSCQNHICFF